ncbi:MAG: ComF family protein [Clostridiales bacterium]|nr:ComF family protein [Clostridiales bacterium]
MKEKINYLLGKFTDLIYPRHCPVCDGLIGYSEMLICEKCRRLVKYVKNPVCVKCGKSIAEEEGEYCYDCARRKHFYLSGMALFEYKSMAASIYRFKYKGRQEYAEFFGKKMAGHLEDYLRVWKPEAFIPVPIHSSRMRTRGYNQAEVLAKRLSRETGIPLRTDIIKRCRKTAPQKNLSDEERQNNLKKAFKICRNDVKLNTIVIIDDIYTTGSTIDAVAYELQKKGIINIYYAALAIGKGL